MRRGVGFLFGGDEISWSLTVVKVAQGHTRIRNPLIVHCKRVDL